MDPWQSMWAVFAVVVAALFAVMFQHEVPADAILVNKTLATDTSDVKAVFTYVSDPKNLVEWFPGVTEVVPRDSKPLKTGKRYDAKLELPLIGVIDLPLTVYKFTEAAGEVTFSVSSSLRPLVTFYVTEQERRAQQENIVRVNIVIGSRRRGFLYQCFGVPILSFVGGQQLSMSLFRLRSLLH